MKEVNEKEEIKFQNEDDFYVVVALLIKEQPNKIKVSKKTASDTKLWNLVRKDLTFLVDSRRTLSFSSIFCKNIFY